MRLLIIPYLKFLTRGFSDMEGMTDDQREQIAAVWQALFATSLIRDDNVPCQIKKGLYLGSLGAARNKAALESENVTHILTVASSLTPAYPSDFVYKIISVLDSEDVDLSKYFDECFDFIEEAIGTGGGVLVHCFAGRSRSVTIIISYLMRKYDMSLNKALEYVKEKRPVASPNSGFITLLQNYEKYLQGKRFEHAQEL